MIRSFSFLPDQNISFKLALRYATWLWNGKMSSNIGSRSPTCSNQGMKTLKPLFRCAKCVVVFCGMTKQVCRNAHIGNIGRISVYYGKCGDVFETGWVGGGVTSYIWHSTDVHAEWRPFSALPGIWLAPFLQQKVYDWPYFSWFVCERPDFSDILVNAYIVFAERFVKGACSLGIQWLDCYICLTTSNKWV